MVIEAYRHKTMRQDKLAALRDRIEALRGKAKNKLAAAELQRMTDEDLDRLMVETFGEGYEKLLDASFYDRLEARYGWKEENPERASAELLLGIERESQTLIKKPYLELDDNEMVNFYMARIKGQA